MFEDFKHKHRWKYMFSAGDGNEWNWFFCPECMGQAVAKLDTTAGTVDLQIFNAKKPAKKK